MNTEICKTCDVNFQLTHINNKYTLCCFGKEKKNACFIEFLSPSEVKEIFNKSEIINKRKGEIYNSIRYWLHPIKKIKFLKRRIISETCPYYIEHKLSEWNEKK